MIRSQFHSENRARLRNVPLSLSKLSVVTDLSKNINAYLLDAPIMFVEIRDTQKKNDRAVAAAYGFADIFENKPTIGVALMKLYQSL